MATPGAPFPQMSCARTPRVVAIAGQARHPRPSSVEEFGRPRWPHKPETVSSNLTRATLTPPIQGWD